MADRAAQIVSEWFVKCANVVLQSRIVLDATEGKQNRWFNLDVTELEAHAPSLQPWRSKRTGAGGTRQDQLPPLILEVYVSSNVSDSVGNDERVMVERWVLRHDTDPGGAEGGAEEGADTAVQDGTVDGDTRERVGAVAFTSRPLLDRTDPGVCHAGQTEDVGEECELEVPSVEATAELMEALMAEARDDYKESKEEEDEEEDVDVDVVEEGDDEEPGESVSALERELELCFADVDERIRVLHRLWHASGGNRRRGIGTAPSGASRDASRDVPVASASVEWPLPPLPPVESSSSGFGGDMQERERDVQLERHVRAKLRSFIRASVELEQSISDSRPASAVGNSRGDRSSVSFSGWATAGAVGLLRTDRGAEGTSGSFDSDLDGYVESCLVSSDDEVGDE